MKIMSANTQAAIDNPNTEPIRLLVISFSGLTLYLCDRVFGDPGQECMFNGNLYEPLILSFGTVQTGEMDPTSWSVNISETDFVIDNSQPVGGADSFTRLFSSYTPHFAGVTISEIFPGASAADDQIEIFDGQIEDFQNMSADQVTILCSGFDLSIKNRFPVEILEDTTFPNADPDDLGKMLPQVWGSARRVPLLSLDVGGLTTLAESLSVSDTTAELTDADRFGSSGSFLVGDDTITYTGKSGNQLTGVSGVSVDHAQGEMVGEIQSEYVYGLGHPVKAIDDVYVDETRQDSSEYTVYTGQTGDEHASWPGRAVVAFNQWPIIKREVDLSVVSSGAGGTVERKATYINTGRPVLIDPYGRVAKLSTYQYLNFPAAPPGTLDNIYAEYEFEFRQFGTMTGSCDFTLDGIKVAELRDGVFTQFITSPLTVEKSSWPTQTIKSGPFREGSMAAISFTVIAARLYCESDTADTAKGGYVAKTAENLPCGTFTSDTAVDTDTAITFPADPSGTLSEIQIEITWEYQRRGEVINMGCPRYFEIGGFNVLCIQADGTLLQLLPNTITIPKSTWQTSIDKTVSRIGGWRRGEQLVITSAVQSCYSTDVSAGLALSGNSMADAVIGGNVYADIDGYQDDGSGTYTGTAGALIERPDHILKHILLDRCGLDAARIHAAMYTAAGSEYAGNSFTQGVVLLQSPDIRSLINRVAHQAKSIEFWEAGQHVLKYIPVGNSIFMDNGGLGTSWTGSWPVSGAADSYGNISVYSVGAGDTYTFEQALTGFFGVSLWWTYHSNRCEHVFVGIYDGVDLIDTVEVNHLENAGQWNSVGDYEFSGTARIVIHSVGGCSTSVDGVRFIFLAESVDKTLDKHRVDLNSIYVQYTPRAEVKNTLSARFDRDWSGYSDNEEDSRAVVTATDAASVAKYGTLTAEQFSYAYIRGETQAQAVLDREQDEQADTRLLIDLAGGYYLADLERGDIVNFDFTTGDELDQALLGLVTSATDLFRVINQVRQPGIIHLKLVAV